MLERDPSSTNTNPIFIGGMMKSGTSLLRKLLSLHPNIFGGLETHWFLPYREVRRKPPRRRCTPSPHRMRDAVDAVEAASRQRRAQRRKGGQR